MINTPIEWPPCGGEMAALIRNKDWSLTPLGKMAQWPGSLKIAVSAVLDSPLPMVVLWGPELTQLYNDAYQVILGQRHPVALGQSARECWPEMWDINEPIYRRVLDRGEPVFIEKQEYVIESSGTAESMFAKVSYTPTRDEDGAIHGVTLVVIDTTSRVVIERQHSEIPSAQSALNKELEGKVELLQNQDRYKDFQLALADGLRDLDPDAAIYLASSLLGEHLGVSRVLYAEVDEAAGTFIIRRDWLAGGLASISGEARQLSDFGPEMIASLRAGQAMVVDNIALDPRTAAFAHAYEAINVRANLAIPLVKSGQMLAVLSLQNTEPRHWTPEDVKLSAEVAERTWATSVAARAQADLRLERDQTQHIFDIMAEGIAVMDRNWILQRMNAEGLRLGKRTEQEVIGRSHWEIWPECIGSDLQLFYTEVMESRIASKIEYHHAFSNDVQTWFDVHAYPTKEGGLAIFFRDIDERKQNHEKLQTSDRRKDEFLAMLAHELRNPLAPISAAAQLLKRGKLDEISVKKSSEIIDRQVQHLTRLVDDLLDVSRVNRGMVKLEMVPVEIRTVLADAVEQVNPMILRQGHHLAMDIAPGEARVLGDAKRLVQVISNLLANAAKYTPKGGNLRLAMRLEQNNVVVTVQDNGVGIAADLIPDIFKLFVQAERTADRTSGGLGLGLTLVRTLAELHGGKASCVSDGLDRGSIFTVTLPLLKSDVIADNEVQGVSQPVTTGGPLLIMVVDDNVDAAVTLGMFLEAQGHRVLLEHTSRAALERARIALPDVCLLDIGLPEIDGNQLARQLRLQSETASTTLIAVTGYGREEDRNNSLAAGFNEHIVKPVDIERLESLLAAVVRR